MYLLKKTMIILCQNILLHVEHGGSAVFLWFFVICVLHFSGKPRMSAEQVGLQFLEAHKCVT